MAQHHFTVWYDTKTERWDIGHANYDEDTPLFDTDEEEWCSLHGSDARRDNELLDELRNRLSVQCGEDFMAGAICILPKEHSGPHANGE